MELTRSIDLDRTIVAGKLEDPCEFRSGNPACEQSSARDEPISPRAATQLLTENFRKLFCSADEREREETFGALWHPNPIIYDAAGADAGRSAVLNSAKQFNLRIREFDEIKIESVAGSHDFHLMRWSTEGGAKRISGSQVAFIRQGRIEALYLVDD